ncbi:MAG: outer membrane beta-barrel protein [Gemmatimonadales bacterium]
MQGIAKAVVAVGLGLGLHAANLHAQTPVRFGLGGGVSIPSGSFSNSFKTGWNGTALVQFMPASSPVGFQVDGSYHQMKFESGGGKEQIIDGTANVVYEFKTSPDSRFRPYLIGGGGVYNLKEKFDVGSSASTTKFGINAGAGFNFGAASTSLFVEGRFHNVFVTGSDFHFIPIVVGVRFGGSGGGT